jgi:hypothetical protein
MYLQIMEEYEKQYPLHDGGVYDDMYYYDHLG